MHLNFEGPQVVPSLQMNPKIEPQIDDLNIIFGDSLLLALTKLCQC